MEQVRVQSLKNQSQIADKCFVANHFLARLKGLIGTSRLAPGEGILLSPCNDIHMWFMSMPIDVVFVRPQKGTEEGAESGATHVVCSTREGLRPWKLLPVRDGKARETLELPVGTIQRCEITAGDKLCIS
jgi:hypothetical protein